MKLLSVFVMALCCAGSTLANRELAVEEAIAAQEKAWAMALLAGDLDTVSSIMHRDFRLIRAYGDEPPISKESYLGIKGMSASSVKVTSVRITEKAGPVVIARVTWSLDWQQEGVGKLPPHFDMIDSWIQGEDGSWRILSRLSQVAKSPPVTESGQ